jgi:signal transduction histidine kinase/DNA-binding response OmpR family regulator
MLRMRLVVFLLITAAFAGLALLEFLYFPGRSQRALRESLEAKAVAVAELTAYSVQTALEFDDHAVVKEYLTGAMRDRELRHVAVLDAKGEPFEAVKRAGVAAAGRLAGSPRTSATELDGDLYVVAPVAAGKPYPSVVVSYSQAGIRAQSRENEQTAFEIALAITLAGMGVAAWIVLLSQRHHKTELARERAEAASKAKGDFVARVSHEIRTPLNGVVGIVDLLFRTELGGRQRQLVRTLQRSGRHLLGVINDILDLSKIEVGELELRAERVDLADVVEDAAELAASQLRPGVELVSRLDPLLPRGVRGDGQRLLQVLTNLLGNAVKFTQSGEIVVRADVTRASEALTSVRFSVKDSGIGISKAEQSKLFQSFYQASGSSRNFGGTGLGLSISQELVKRMGGEIHVESDSGKGSEFSFELELELLEAAEPPSRELAGLSLLVVAPAVLGRELTAFCQRFGIESKEVAESSAVGHEIERSSYDVVVLDTGVPGADLELARALLDRWPALRVVLLYRAIDFSEAGEPGTDVLVKPVRQEALFRSIGALVGRLGPTSHGAAVSSRPARERRSFMPVHGTVLAAEDNPTNQEVLRALLDELGYGVEIHRNGLEVVAAFERGGSYCMALMDCQMPELDGYAAARRMRAHEAKEGKKRLPILALTAGTPAEVREQVLASGMDGVLPKPIGLESLRQTIQEWCGEVKPVTTLDPLRIAELLRLQTPVRPHFVRDLVARFVADAGLLLTTLQSAAAAADAERLRETAHALKGSSRNLGAKPLSLLCESLERRATEGKLDGATELVARVADELAKARQELERLGAPARATVSGSPAA